MNRVAIMTWFSYRNFGTALQATAMSLTVSKLGYQPVFISYDPEPAQRAVRSERKTLMRRALGKVRWLLSPHPVTAQERDVVFDRFLKTNLVFTEAISANKLPDLSDEYTAFLCGSDQVWSPRCFDAHYYLDFVKDSQKKIAYAPSFGCDDIESVDIKYRIASLLGEFGSISVREESGAEIVQELTGVRPQVTLDPTLLLDADTWSGLSIPCSVGDDSYCLFYFLGNHKGNRRAARRIAESTGLRVIEVPVFQNRQGRPGVLGPDVGPGEFISLVRNATLVCTDSFHGMVFSALFERPFIPFERFNPNDSASQNTRVYNFLSLLGLEEILLTRANLRDWQDYTSPQIDYENVGRRIEARRKDSMRYLRDALASATQRSNPS